MRFFEAVKLAVEEGAKIRHVTWDTGVCVYYNKDKDAFIDDHGKQCAFLGCSLSKDEWAVMEQPVTDKELLEAWGIRVVGASPTVKLALHRCIDELRSRKIQK